jgi:predicted acylesterase/phospholipase RssA
MRLTVHRGSASGSSAGKTALCLCGGGLTGALFEVGVLAGFDDAMGHAAANDFEIYVGSSAGASIASIISQGVPAERAFSALRNPGDSYFPLQRQDVYRARLAPWLKSTGRMFLDAALILVTHFPGRNASLADRLAQLQYTLPSGVFSTDHYAGFLREFFARERLTNRFDEIARELYIVANDVDSAQRVVFGDGDLRQVEIATAVAASSAIPMFFEPVRLGQRDYFDGGIGRVDHIDVAIAHGAERILVVNPVVPVRLDQRNAHLRDRGLLAVGNQAFRIMNKARLHFGIKRYLAEHPTVEVLLLEPGEEESILFTNSSMNLAARAEILDYARGTTRRALHELYSKGVRIQQPSSNGRLGG